VRPEGFLGNFIGLGNEAGGVRPDGAHRLAKLGAGALVKVDLERISFDQVHLIKGNTKHNERLA